MPEYVNMLFSCAVILSVVALIVSHVIERRRKTAAAARMAADPVRVIAERVRRAFEKIASYTGHSEDLGGLCGRAAVQFCLEAERAGISAKLVHGNGHAYSMLSDKQIVDVTATQFTIPSSGDSYAPVEIGHISDKRFSSAKWWTSAESWDSVGEWLEKSEERLYGARRDWENDRKIMEETA